MGGRAHVATGQPGALLTHRDVLSHVPLGSTRFYLFRPHIWIMAVYTSQGSNIVWVWAGGDTAELLLWCEWDRVCGAGPVALIQLDTLSLKLSLSIRLSICPASRPYLPTCNELCLLVLYVGAVQGGPDTRRSRAVFRAGAHCSTAVGEGKGGVCFCLWKRRNSCGVSLVLFAWGRLR